MLAPRLRRVVFGLGSNLGDRLGYVRAGLAGLRGLAGVQSIARSGFYETKPVGGPPQGDYINAAVVLRTARVGSELLREALALERRQGRVRGVRNGPRTLDIDLLWIEGEELSDPWLTVPHPRLTERAFALVPLLEVAQDARDPRTGRLLASWLPALDFGGLRCLSPPCFFVAPRSSGALLDTQEWKC